MHTHLHRSLRFGCRPLAAIIVFAATAAAQVPDGYVVFGSFQGSSGQNGIYFAHPRDISAPPIMVTGLSPALAYDPTGQRGVASLLRRPSDGALIVGERAPSGTSVDLHVLRLSGAHVQKAQLFSVGTSDSVGEIPQCALLPDERIVLAATDLTPGGPLAHFTNGSYGWQGLGILDPKSGGITEIPVSNWNVFTGVINALTVSRDGNTVYVGAYVSVSSGALWEVPVTGGALTLVSSLPFGASNLAVDLDDAVLITTLNGPDNLYRYDPVTQSTTSLPNNTGPLNAIAVETATGNYLMATANSGTPPRSLVWTEPLGTANVLQSPNLATISALDTNPNPESYGASSGGSVGYRWAIGGDPNALPLTGNADFSLTLAADTPMVALGFWLFSFAPSVPFDVLGVTAYIDLANFVSFPLILNGTATFDWAIPNDPSMIGDELFAQALLVENPTSLLAASPGLSMTIL